MPTFRRLASMLAAGALAGAAVLGTPGTAAASEEVPTTPYCFTVDGSGVCVVFGLSVTKYPDTDTGDATVALSAQVGFYCPGLALRTCQAAGAIAPIEVGRTGVVAGDPRVEDRYITTLRVPEVCVPGGCVGPYLVPVYAPMVTGSVATLWLLGQDTSEACWLAACP
jgi:hypothetical protein